MAGVSIEVCIKQLWAYFFISFYFRVFLLTKLNRERNRFMEKILKLGCNVKYFNLIAQIKDLVF